MIRLFDIQFDRSTFNFKTAAVVTCSAIVVVALGALALRTGLLSSLVGLKGRISGQSSNPALPGSGESNQVSKAHNPANRDLTLGSPSTAEPVNRDKMNLDGLSGKPENSTKIDNVNRPISSVQQGNATPKEFVDCVCSSIVKNLHKHITEEKVQEFVNRGGIINIATPEKTGHQPITIKKSIPVITGCASGVNRSQVVAVQFKSWDINVLTVLAGGDSDMNPYTDLHMVLPVTANEKPENFQEALKGPRIPVLGSETNSNYTEDPAIVQSRQKFYQDYINQLIAPVHFVTFSNSGLSVLERLLKREGSLEGFTITHCPLNDEINHPPLQTYEASSVQAFSNFRDKVKAYFQITDD